MFNKNKIVSKLLVEGMHCNSCAKRIEDALKKNKDIKKVEINLNTKEVLITSTNELDINNIKEIINNLGYSVIDK